MTWRSFWDGGSKQGPIATAWQVRAWPTIYVIDAEGLIRFKNLLDEREVDQAIDHLLSEMGSPKGSAPVKE